MRVIIASLMFVALAMAGCTDSGEYGSASIYVKDAPTDEFSEIHVVFTQVEVHFAGNGTEDEDDAESEDETESEGDVEAEADGETETESDDEDDSSWITLFESEEGVDIDLLSVSGDASAFLGEADLATGKYTQIRIHTTSAYGIDLEGNQVDITVSSGVLKITKPFDVVAGEESQIIVDYDLDKSLKQAGTNWRMTPVVGSVVVEHVDDDESGEDAHEEGEIDDGDDDEAADE